MKQASPNKQRNKGLCHHSIQEICKMYLSLEKKKKTKKNFKNKIKYFGRVLIQFKGCEEVILKKLHSMRKKEEANSQWEMC